MQEWEFENPHLVVEYSTQALATFREADCQTGIIRCLLHIGSAATNTNQPIRARAYLEDALRIAQQTDDIPSIRTTLVISSILDPELAIERCNQVIRVCRQRGEDEQLAGLLYTAGNLLLEHCDFEQAKSSFEESIVMLSQIRVSPGDFGVQRTFSWCHLYLGTIAQIQGNTERAINHLEQAGKLAQPIGHHIVTNTALFLWGMLMLHQGHLREAEAALSESLREMHKHNPPGLAHNIRTMMDLERVKGRWSRAARLTGVYDWLAPRNKSISPTGRLVLFMDTIERNLADPRAQLGDAPYEAEYAIGQQMTVDEAVAYALEG
jgi:tetratricopeptide (TPR) repeat protein